MIGRVGDVCGRHQVNIAHLSLGRIPDKPGGDAIGLFVLDSEPPAEAVTEILGLDPVVRATVVHLPAAGERPAWMGG